MTEPKTKPTSESVEKFLNSIPDKQKREDSFTILEMMKKVTKCKPRMWGTSIIGFGTYRYKYANGAEADWPLAAFSPRKQSLTLYVSRNFDDYDHLLKNLGKHSASKACLYIKRLSDVDLPTLKKLIELSYKESKKSYTC